MNTSPDIYQSTARTLKALADPKRLRIIYMLSCRELCACELLSAFSCTQPTLSHDMRVLVQAGLVRERREGRSIYYHLDHDRFAALGSTLAALSQPKLDCICNRTEEDATPCA